MSNETARGLHSSSSSPTSGKEDTMKVLVVDDDESVRELVCDAMSDQGYQVWAASGGKDAIELATDHAFDLVFCDVFMDGMSGFDVLRELRQGLRLEADIGMMTGPA